jgi:hyperosmotically inducible protein
MKTAAKLMTWTIALGCASVFAADYPSTTKSPASTASAAKRQRSPNADNTDINERDKGGATKTPQDQTNQAPDRKLLAAVRSAVVGDKSLSTKAHNIKIMVQGGGVTLRGPVNSAEEKAKIEAQVKGVHGVTKVDNQLDIKTR